MTKKEALKLLILLCLALSLVSCVTVPPLDLPTNMPDFNQTYILSNQPCSPPCWQDLTIGSSTGEEVVSTLSGLEFVNKSRLVVKDVRVPAENILGEENNGSAIFYQMMIPERMTSAGGAIGMGRAALDVAARYSTRRKAFGTDIKNFQAVSFKVADSATCLDTARGIVYLAARSVDSGDPPGRSRRLVSEAKKVATENAWIVVNNAMQIMGGIGYSNVYPIEKMLRDVRLIMIWTGTNEIMDLIIQHEYYKELDMEGFKGRDIEFDAAEAEQVDEKIYE